MSVFRRIQGGISPLIIPDGDDILLRIQGAHILNKVIEPSCLIESYQIKFKPIITPAQIAGYSQIYADKDDGDKPKWIRPDGSIIDLAAAALGLDLETTGTATGAADGDATEFVIAHSLGSIPFSAFVQVSSVLGSDIPFSYTYDTTNIAVMFSSPPAAGTITFQWRAVA